MSKFLVTALLLSLVGHGNQLARAWDDQDFFTYCPPSKCSKHGPEIRFPFRLESSNTSSLCGRSCLKFACSGQDTILDHQYLGRCKVTAIDYSHKLLTIIPLVSSLSPCPLQKLISKSIPFDVITGYSYLGYATLVCCSKEITPDNDAANYFVGPISCLSNATHFSYMVDALMSMSVLPLDCKVVSDGVIPIPLHNTKIGPSRFKESAKRILSFAETTISWACPNKCSSYIPYTCEESCEFDGRRCAFSSERNQSFCMPNRHGSHVKAIAATPSVATLVVLLLIVATVLYLSLKTRYKEEIHLKVEMFLKVYGTLKPTRYTFTEVKKITRRFKEKIGQGGFGSVYKGELPNGVPVAVKMLENPTGDGEVFINEVATIGLIHHANIVRLLGFCSEGTRRVLIYEFMPDESLEKYIFSHDSNIFQGLLVPDKMQDIVLGIA